MERALIISHGEKSVDFFKQVLKTTPIHHITVLSTCNEARLLMLEQEFDIVLINAPLKDETGEQLALHTITKGISQVILVAPVEIYNEIFLSCTQNGILTLNKPISKTNLWSAIQLAQATRVNIKQAQQNNKNLQQKINDIRFVDKAKRVLIETRGMDENEAHHYIEKKAMNTRLSKRAVAEGILRSYGY